MTIPGISKSRFTDFLKCPRLGYLSCYPGRYAALRDPFDWATEQRLLTGVRAGELARTCFPGGILVEHGPKELAAALQATRTHLDAGADVVFEATFERDGILVRADVLRRLAGGEFELIEVKAANSYKKADHLPDVAIQLHVLEEAGLTVGSAKVMHFDKTYRHPGGPTYDPDAIFSLDDVTADARAYARTTLPAQLGALRRTLALPEPPPQLVKNSCKTGCPYYQRVCLPGAPKFPVTELGGVHKTLLASLAAEGIDDLRDVDPGFPGLKPLHLLMLQAMEEGGLKIADGICDQLCAIVEYPVSFMDFETYSPGFPVFPSMGTWQHIPFQWSLHVLEADGSLRHLEFLAENLDDPRRAFAESLLRSLPPSGTVVVYDQTFEIGRLRELSETFPHLADSLTAIEPRVLDLMKVVADGCYHPDFHGSRSLKAVLPALVPELSYGDLDIGEGTAAMRAYATILDPETTPETRARLREALRRYCELHTLATVEVFKVLAGVPG